MKPIKIESLGYYNVYTFAISGERWSWEIAIFIGAEPKDGYGQMSYAHIKANFSYDSQIDAVAAGRSVAKALGLKKRVA